MALALGGQQEQPWRVLVWKGSWAASRVPRRGQHGPEGQGASSSQGPTLPALL